MQINIKFSASYSAVSGVEEFSVDMPDGSTVEQLIKMLSENYTDLHLDKKETMVVIKDRIATRHRVLNDNEKAVIFHLFAGG